MPRSSVQTFDDPGQLQAALRTGNGKSQTDPYIRTPNPLFNYSLPQLRDANVARNLGMLLGLPGLWSLAPLTGILLLLTLAWRYAARLPFSGRAAHAQG